jgi:hypothetical protein
VRVNDSWGFLKSLKNQKRKIHIRANVMENAGTIDTQSEFSVKCDFIQVIYKKLFDHQ